MRTVLVALVLVLAAGCGGGDGLSSADHARLKEDKPQKAEKKLIEICPQVESVLLDPYDVPTNNQWVQLRDELASYAASADLEARNALEGLTEAVQVFVDRPTPGSDFLDATSGLRNSVSTFAARCKAVGSSALQ